jgi:hypothetical protein
LYSSLAFLGIEIINGIILAFINTAMCIEVIIVAFWA